MVFIFVLGVVLLYHLFIRLSTRLVSGQANLVECLVSNDGREISTWPGYSSCVPNHPQVRNPPDPIRCNPRDAIAGKSYNGDARTMMTNPPLILL